MGEDGKPVVLTDGSRGQPQLDGIFGTRSVLVSGSHADNRNDGHLKFILPHGPCSILEQ